MRFEWDESKNRANRAKHGLWFEEAQSVFNDEFARLFKDPDHSGNEDRFLLFGISGAGRCLIVVHCYRADDQIVRIISARRMTKKERKFYEEGI